MKVRDLSIDYAKGIAILAVYIGHSVLYYPDGLFPGEGWLWFRRLITSFNMPLFFFISGLLFGFSNKSNGTVIKDKLKRLVIPYLFTMFIVEVSKLFMPSSMAYKPSEGGVIYMLKDVLLYGGDRWFVYVLFIIFCICIPLRKLAKTKWVFLISAVFFTAALYLPLPHDLFCMFDVIRYLPFFMIGMFFSSIYSYYKMISQKYVFVFISLFVLLNMIFQPSLWKVDVFRYVILPIIGIGMIMAVAFVIPQKNSETKQSVALRYLEYCGRYSLQFYLFTFAYPIIRYFVVSVLNISNSFCVLSLMFILQLIAITVVIEITRRISFLKIPMGY